MSFGERLAGLTRALGRIAGGGKLRCEPPTDARTLRARPSPFRSLHFDVDGTEALVCYSAPSVRDRTIFGELVPFGELWRTGANEPTVLHLAGPITVAGLSVEAGRYAVYTVPGPSEWTVVLNGSVPASGRTRTERGPRGNSFPSAYTEDVRAKEVGRAEVTVEAIPHVETMTFRASRASEAGCDLLLEWERSRVTIPLRRG